MLTKLHNEPFKYTVTNLRKIIDSQFIENQQDHIKRTLRTLSQISNLNQLLTILLDYHWFNRFCWVVEKLTHLFTDLSLKHKNLKSQDNLPGSPFKTFEQNRQMMLKGTKKIELTPSTKKSRNMGTPTVTVLLQDLAQGLQKFDQIKHNSKRIKLLIEEIYQQIHIDQENQSQFNQDVDIENAWTQLIKLQFQKFQKLDDFPLAQNKVQHLKQLLEQIQTIHKFMEVIRITTHDIFSLIEPKSLDQLDNQSHYSSNIQSITKKSNNPTSEQRSLLTEMLRQSSQKSSLQIQQNEFSSQIVLRPRFKQYSQNEDMAFLDDQYKLSQKSAKAHVKSQKLIRSQMNYDCPDMNTPYRFTIKKKQIKIKQAQIGCSRCQIF